MARRRQGVGCADGGRPGIRYTSHGHAGSRCGPHRSRTDPRRRGLHQQQEGADRIAKIHSRRSWPGQTRPLPEREFHRPTGASGRKAGRTSATLDGAGNRLERSRIVVRPDGTRATDARYRFARTCTRLQRARSGREGDLDYVVASAEKTDCAGQFGASARNTAHPAADGDDGGSGSEQSIGHRPFPAVLQSTAQNQDAHLAAIKKDRLTWSGRTWTCGKLSPQRSMAGSNAGGLNFWIEQTLNRAIHRVQQAVLCRLNPGILQSVIPVLRPSGGQSNTATNWRQYGVAQPDQDGEVVRSHGDRSQN